LDRSAPSGDGDLLLILPPPVSGPYLIEHERLSALRAHYLFDSHFCSPARGNEKCSVEDPVGYVRRNALVPYTRSFSSMTALNAHLREPGRSSTPMGPASRSKMSSSPMRSTAGRFPAVAPSWGASSPPPMEDEAGWSSSGRDRWSPWTSPTTSTAWSGASTAIAPSDPSPSPRATAGRCGKWRLGSSALGPPETVRNRHPEGLA